MSTPACCWASKFVTSSIAVRRSECDSPFASLPYDERLDSTVSVLWPSDVSEQQECSAAKFRAAFHRRHFAEHPNSCLENHRATTHLYICTPIRTCLGRSTSGMWALSRSHQVHPTRVPRLAACTCRSFAASARLARSEPTQPRVAVLYQELDPPLINGVRKPKKPGGIHSKAHSMRHLDVELCQATKTPVQTLRMS